MKKANKTNVLIIVCVFLTTPSLSSLTGCATEKVVTTGKQHTATRPDKVAIYNVTKPKKQYDEIGRVSVDKYNNFGISRSGKELDKLLKEKAASIGGDAIISVSEDFGSISGIVIKTR